MKKSIALILLIAAFFVAVPEARAADGDVKLWSSAPLVWNDFRAEPLLADGPAYIATDIRLTTDRSTVDGKESFTMRADAVMYPERSYASEAERTPERLRYFQTQFDLTEVLARRLQEELASGMNGIEADSRLNYYRDLLKTQSRTLADETLNGTDEIKLQQCEYQLRRRLEELGEIGVPQVVPSRFRYGLFAGTGAVFSTGPLSDYFSSAWDFTFGLLGSWRRISLEGSITYASPSIGEPTLTETKYLTGTERYHANVKNANYLAIGFNAGYNVVDTKKFTVRPFVGGMWTSFSWTARPVTSASSDENVVFDGLQQRMMVDDFNVTFGCTFEWHFHSVVTNFPFLGSMREEYISSLRVSPYAVRGVYTDADRHFGGWQIGFTVAYSGVGRALGFK